VLPLLLANFTVMSYIVTNHQLNPLATVNDPLATSLSVRVPRWVDILHLNFSHHTEHHLFPGLNPVHAPKVKALVKRLWPDRYHDMPHWRALWALWKTPRIYTHKVLLTDPVRGTAFPTLGHGLAPDKLAPVASPVAPPLPKARTAGAR
jgi:fatty acid desaturase